MKLLMIGDVVSQPGCETVRSCLPALKRRFGADVAIVNGENSAVGNGILPGGAEHLLDSGADVITTGNHAFKRREMYDYFSTHEQVLRPANYPAGTPGSGVYRYDGGAFSLLVINLQGTSFMEPLENPFTTADRILREEEKATFALVDFHAEATGEKKAMGFYLDGRVSAVFGTHTHVQTADEEILSGGTAYLTDVGMTGPARSALGVKPLCVIERLRTNLPIRFEVDQEADCRMDGVFAEFDRKTGFCVQINRFCARIGAGQTEFSLQIAGERDIIEHIKTR